MNVPIHGPNCRCATLDPDSVLLAAVRTATASLADQPGILSTIRNGGWEHAFRNRILQVTDDRSDIIGFAEACISPVTRIDLAYRCGEHWFLAGEVKANFAIQSGDIKRGRVDACLQLQPLLSKGLPGYLIYVVIKQTFNHPESTLVSAHNGALGRSSKYKRFVEVDSGDLPPDDMFSRSPPAASVERPFATHEVTVSIRVWLARCSTVPESGDMLLRFITGRDVSIEERVTARELDARRQERQRRHSRKRQVGT